MISRSISRASAALLFAGGGALLFAPQEILTRLAPGFPASASWLGQLVGAGWLAMAGLNWLSRSALLGGIYGRPVVFANTALYLISALALLDAALAPGSGTGLWILTVIVAVPAAVYGWLLLKGPADRDLAEQGGGA